MQILIDDARVAQIRALDAHCPIAGVTTNPTILLRAGRPPYEALREIRAALGDARALHVQVTAAEAEGMMREAERIVSRLGEGTYIKVPCVPEGYRALMRLHREGYRTTGTAVTSASQAFLAAECGADFVAPYVNRMDQMGYDGVGVVREIQALFGAQGSATQVLGASFRNARQVLALAEAGCSAVTVSPDVLEAMLHSAAADEALARFAEDFERLVGAGRTMADCD